MPTPYERALRNQRWIVAPQESSSSEVRPVVRARTALFIQPRDTSGSVPPITQVIAASSSSESPAPAAQNEASRFSSLGPIGRLRKLARTEPVNFASTLVAIPGSIYLLLRSIIAIFPEILAWFSINAKAEAPTGLAAVVAASGRDAFDWFVALLMAVTLVAALGATLFAENSKKIDFGKDMTKVIVGFIVGFLSGGRVR